MAPDNALDPVLADLTFAASQARLAGPTGETLANELDMLIERYRTGAAPAPTDDDPSAERQSTQDADMVRQFAVEADPARDDDTDDTDATCSTCGDTGLVDWEPGALPHDEDQQPCPDCTGSGVAPEPDDPQQASAEQDALAYLRAQIDEVGDDVYSSLVPQDLTLYVTRTDGFWLSTIDAVSAVEDVLDSLVARVGPLDIDTAELDDDEPSQVNVVLTAGPGTNLARFGAGKDGFNATFDLVGVGEVRIRSRVGDVDDPELADQLGMLPPDLPEQPEGKHPINGTVDLVEAVTGQAVEAVSTLFVRYTKDNGQPMTAAEARTILEHPISTGPGGLTRFGAYEVREVREGRLGNEQIAVIDLVGDGELDARTVKLRSTEYGGTMPFPGMGKVTALAFTRLEDALLDDEDEYEYEEL